MNLNLQHSENIVFHNSKLEFHRPYYRTEHLIRHIESILNSNSRTILYNARTSVKIKLFKILRNLK